MKKIHYSRAGYNGDYTYTSVCGKQVKTHQENEGSSIYPELANCKECLATNEYKVDVGKTTEDIKIRIYIESDILHADEFTHAQRRVFDFAKRNGLTCVDRVFSKVLDYAWHDLEKTWQAVREADEIYATSSLLPLCGNPSMGAPVIFNGMCERAIKENITGKSVIILNRSSDVCWDYIDISAMKKAFKNNSLLMYADGGRNIVKIDCGKLKRK